MNIWFTSDTHFYHPNVIIHCDRPWLKEGDFVAGKWVSREIATQRAHEMTEDLIDIWNKHVKDGDRVYHLGDFCWKTKVDVWAELVDRLNGDIFLVKGNHDLGRKQITRYFAGVDWLKVIKHNGQHITLCHYAMRTWYRSHHGTWQLYGHSHGQLPGIGKQMDVGMDCNDYRPIHISEIVKRMNELPNNLPQGEHND